MADRPLISLVVSFALLAGSARAADFTDYDWTPGECITVTTGRLEIATCSTGCGSDLTGTWMTVPHSGVFTVDLDWLVEADNSFTALYVEVNSLAVFQQGHVFGSAWCGPAPCTGGTDGISFHVEEGDRVTIRMDAIEIGCATGGTVCTFSNLRFEPDLGLFPEGGALAPSLLHLMEGTESGQMLGAAVALIGDVDGDGHSEIAVGSPLKDGAAGAKAGELRLVSGGTGAVLKQWEGSRPEARLGFAIAALGDVDGDRVPDVLASELIGQGAGGAVGLVHAFSGATGEVLATLSGTQDNERFGTSLAVLGDVDADGDLDVVVGSPRYDETGLTDSGRVRVLSLLDGVQVHEFLGGKAGIRLGLAVSSAGDVDGDTLPDIAVGAPWDDVPTFGGGSVRVYSGGSGALLHEFTALGPVELFGSALANVGDLDGDGRPDLAIGAPLSSAAGSVSGRIEVRSGVDGALLRRIAYPGLERLGAALFATGDVDGDGLPDLLAGAPWTDGNQGRVLLISLGDGTELLSLDGEPHSVQFLGSALGGGATVDADAIDDWIVGAPGSGSSNGVPGLAQVLSGEPVDHVPPQLDGTGALLPGTPFTLDLTDGPPGGMAALVVGFSKLGEPFKGGILVPNPDLMLMGLVLDPVGGWSLPATWPSGTPPILTLRLQAWIAGGGGPEGLLASNSLKLVAP